MEKKTLALGLIAIIAVGFGITGVVLFFIEEPAEGEGALPTTLVLGTMYIVVDLDPQGSWDSASMDVIDQVCEGLLAYDFFDENLAIVPQLATGMGVFNPAGTEYTIQLREDVTFHDGTNFNATAVKFTWDRMAWALNTTGTNMIDVTIIEELYVFPNTTITPGEPIVDDVIINSEYNVTFVLNRPYIAFEALLCFEASYILSPTSTPADRYLETATDDLVGTGPYEYDSTEAAVEVKLHAYEDYYLGKAPIENVIFSEITDSNARNIALLAGDVHWLNDPMWEYWPVFEYESDITLNVSAYGTTVQYLGMNNNLINLTMRKAISQAIDYEYLIDSLTLGHARRLESPIPEGIEMADWSYSPLEYNVTAARLLMQDMDFGAGWNATYAPDAIDPDTDLPYNLNEDDWRTASFKTYKYTYNIGNSFREDMLIYLFDALKDIGIKVVNDGMTWGDFVHRLYELEPYTRNDVDLFFIGWIPDYNDPSNYINPLFTNRTVGANGVQYNGFLAASEAGRDPFLLNDNVQLLMEAALADTNPVTRATKYSRIQELLVEQDFPWAFCYNPQPADAYTNRLHGIAPSCQKMNRKHVYSMYFA